MATRAMSTVKISAAEMEACVTKLQQKAQVPKSEVAERKKAQRTLRKSESELADLLENALEGVQRSGLDQKIVWANKMILNLLGYKSEEYIGHSLAEFFVQSEALAEFWAKLMRHEEIYNYRAELRCKDGSISHVLINSNGLWEDGRFVHTRTFIHDVTERIEMEEALKLAHDELEMRVMQRTAEINEKNAQLRSQREALTSTNEGLRELSARLVHVQDEERRRIARDLHDSTGQALALLSMNLSVLGMEVGSSSPELAKSLSENVAIVRQISTELRTLSYFLHPPMLDEVGLKSALRWYIDGFAERSNIKVRLELSDDLGRLPREMEIALFRVIQECLTNIHRHSGTVKAIIQLHSADGAVTLAVKDEGKGITPDRLSKITSSRGHGVGIRGMQERVKNLGGELGLSSDARGTEIKVVIPRIPPTPRLQRLEA
jgi:PAS domain S-box-containing protein